MEINTFLLKNVPSAERELIRDFVESSLDIDVIVLEYSKINPTTVLVVLSNAVDFSKVTELLMKNEADLDISDGSLQVLEAKCFPDKVVVDGLDENILSTFFLTKYIESIFNDGNEAVVDTKTVSEYNWIILSFTDIAVTARVLENEDHQPLQSLDYHIYIKPCLEGFHTTLLEEPKDSHMSEEFDSKHAQDNISCKDVQTVSQPSQGTKERLNEKPQSASESSFEQGNRTYKDLTLKAAQCYEEIKAASHQDKQNNSVFKESASSVQEQETLKVQWVIFRLLENKLKDMKSEYDYSEKDQILTINGQDALNTKGKVLDILRGISSSRLQLNEDLIEFLKRDAVRERLEMFVTKDLNAAYEIDETDFIIHSFDDCDRKLQEVSDNYLCSEEIPHSDDVPAAKLQLQTKGYFVMLDFLDNRLKVTGLKEDVYYAVDNLQNILEDCNFVKKSVQVNGKVAVFVKEYDKILLEKLSLLEGVKTSVDRKGQQEVFIAFECKKFEVEKISLKVNEILNSIVTSNILLSDHFVKEELSLVKLGIRNDKGFINQFEQANRCCVLVPEVQQNEFLKVSNAHSTHGAKNEDSHLSFEIVHEWHNNPSELFVAELKEKWLYFTTFEVDCWPQGFVQDAMNDAKALNVWMKKKQDSTAQKTFFELKGDKNNVLRLKEKMHSKIVNNISQLKKDLFSKFSPKRDTLEFVKYAAEWQIEVPTYWKNSSGDHTSHEPVDVVTAKVIEKLICKTWKKDKVGHGNDAKNIPANSDIRVIKIERFENLPLFHEYAHCRKTIFKDMAKRNHLCQNIEKLPGSTGPVAITQFLDNNMAKELCREINECYLLHGTKPGVLAPILEHGFDLRLASPAAMFGQGVYFAESSTKADQYSDPIDNRLPNGTDLTMILSRVCLGDVFLCDHNHPTVAQKKGVKLVRPPCTHCLSDKCACSKPHFHSVLGDGKWIFREFVTYRNIQCYPEYIITYQRV